MHRFTKTLVPFALAAMFLVPLSACQKNVATGRMQFVTMSRADEIRIGSEYAPQLTEEFGGRVQDPRLQSYVSDIGNRLAAVTEADNPSLPWEFVLLDSEVINAFALPGGKVFISRGLAEHMTNEAQMAAVLGHEIGHVTARHGNERMGQQTLLVLGGTLAGAIGGAAAGGRDGAATGAAVGSTIGSIAALSYSRDQEIEADRLGMRYMEMLRYDPVGAIQLQEILARASSGAGRPPEFLSTHPTSSTRIRELNNRLSKYYAHTRNNPEYSLHEERFRREFLTHLLQVQSQRGDGTPGRPRMLAAINLADPASWCALCAMPGAGGGAHEHAPGAAAGADVE